MDSGRWQELRWTLAVLGTLSLGHLLWCHYGILRHAKLPEHDLGLPLIGHTMKIFRESLEGWALRVMKGKPVHLSHYLFSHAVIVRHEIYMKHLNRAELDGQLCPLFPAGVRNLVGENSVISLPGGKGHSKHKRLRNKLLRCLGPQYVLSLKPDIEALIRSSLEELVVETRQAGFARLAPAAARLAAKVSVLPVLAGLQEEEQKHFESLLEVALQGMLAIPVDLGTWSAYGRAKRARKELSKMVSKIKAAPSLDRQNIVADLMKDSEDGQGFSQDEITDTVVTLLFAGKITTAEALPSLFVKVCEHRSWVPRLASSDGDRLNFVREVLRSRPPVGAFRRVAEMDMELGGYGVVPKGCPMAVLVSMPMMEMGGFNPDRWTTEDLRSKFLAFGGPQPHECIGKHLALTELELFAEILCQDYEFEAVDPTEVVDASNPISMSYRDGCHVKVTKK